MKKSPPAFPYEYSYSSGMTLRQYYAGQALMGILAGGFADTIPHSDLEAGWTVAAFAHHYADAMLAHGEKYDD